MRALSTHGEYIWKDFTVLRIQKDRYLILVRIVHDSVLGLEEVINKNSEDSGLYSPDNLWRNLINSDIIRIFWKDKDRRFLGVSNAFLKYYGFDSPNVIIGKTDEDMEWHIHPDKYKNDETNVIREGLTTHSIPGRCLVKGENREIFASKTPLYDKNGEIQGLIGFFIDRDLLTANDQRGADTKRRDIHTGLMNSRGIAEEANRLKDEFYLRNKDFVRMHISIDNFEGFNERYGYDFGDKLLFDFGEVLRRTFGHSCIVGRQAGSRFVLMKQIETLDDAVLLREQLRHTVASISEVNNKPVTIYLSAGYAVFSECESLSEQEKLAERRILADHNKNVSNEIMIARAAELFHFFDDMPVVYAVYHVTRNEESGTTDAVLFYVNHAYEKAVNQKSKDILGRGVRELYTFIDENWHSKMVKAALDGEVTTGLFTFDPTGVHYKFQANPIIYSGYCAVTYIEI